MHQLARARRAALRQVVLLAEDHRQAASGGVAGDPGAVDAAADHQKVDHARLSHAVLLSDARVASGDPRPSSIARRRRRRQRLPDRRQRAAGLRRRPGTAGRRAGRARGPAPRPAPSSGVTQRAMQSSIDRVGADRHRRHHRRARRTRLLPARDPHRRLHRGREHRRAATRDRAAPPVSRSSDGSSPIAA